MDDTDFDTLVDDLDHYNQPEMKQSTIGKWRATGRRPVGVTEEDEDSVFEEVRKELAKIQRDNEKKSAQSGVRGKKGASTRNGVKAQPEKSSKFSKENLKKSSQDRSKFERSNQFAQNRGGGSGGGGGERERGSISSSGDAGGEAAGGSMRNGAGRKAEQEAGGGTREDGSDERVGGGSGGYGGVGGGRRGDGSGGGMGGRSMRNGAAGKAEEEAGRGRTEDGSDEKAGGGSGAVNGSGNGAEGQAGSIPSSGEGRGIRGGDGGVGKKAQGRTVYGGAVGGIAGRDGTRAKVGRARLNEINQIQDEEKRVAEEIRSIREKKYSTNETQIKGFECKDLLELFCEESHKEKAKNEKQCKAGLKSCSKKYHPDRVPRGYTSDQKARSSIVFDAIQKFLKLNERKQNYEFMPRAVPNMKVFKWSEESQGTSTGMPTSGSASKSTYNKQSTNSSRSSSSTNNQSGGNKNTGTQDNVSRGSYVRDSANKTSFKGSLPENFIDKGYRETLDYFYTITGKQKSETSSDQSLSELLPEYTKYLEQLRETLDFSSKNYSGEDLRKAQIYMYLSEKRYELAQDIVNEVLNRQYDDFYFEHFKNTYEETYRSMYPDEKLVTNPSLARLSIEFGGKLFYLAYDAVEVATEGTYEIALWYRFVSDVKNKIDEEIKENDDSEYDFSEN